MIQQLVRLAAAPALVLLLAAAFLNSSCNCFIPNTVTFRRSSSSILQMALDPVTFLRTEFVTAALFTNQIPRSADTCLQLGVYDGRAMNFIPRTIREFLTSSLETDGTMNIGIQRSLKQALDARALDEATTIRYLDQRADNLTLVQENSVDVVVSMQSAEKMVEGGLDWRQSIREAGRVLKPGGRFLFVEKTELGEDNYLDFVGNLAVAQQQEDDEEERFPIFESVGWDDVDFVLIPHVAGVFIKRIDAGLTRQERLAAEKKREQDLLAERSLSVFEQRRKRKKNKDTKEEKPAVKK
eukprot:CAMPEP_0172424432 /NCGR_PEP_ID=MMETSP1064-20121228/25100_1 /TAXON_ID=202472 /ORGANISM="Aulacoseira subarctica , Strain CCAP 1002/5" /LENGTH=296 /DNA_ID=CAMNT_0013166497 /DNA_START=7 /DNA_END=897 /DNA_ORIENTATION=+